MRVFIKKSTLTKNTLDSGVLEAVIVSVSCYAGSPITFDLLIDGSFLFSNISIQDIYSKRELSGDMLSKLDYNYKCNLNNDCEVFKYHFDKVLCFDEGNVHEGVYGFTVDMVDDNNMFHFLLLKNGQTCMFPNHKVSFGKDYLPNNWKKQ